MKNKGFSLIEIMVVVGIIGILAVVGVPVYRGHVAKSIDIEAKALLAEISASQEIYKSRKGIWYREGGSSLSNKSVVVELGVDARRNKYFRTFGWNIPSENSNSFSLSTEGAQNSKAQGVTMTLTYFTTQPQVIRHAGSTESL